MKKVLILNQGDTNNLGDVAINRVIKHCFGRDFSIYNECFWSNEKVFGKKYQYYPKALRWLLWHCMFLMDFFNAIYIKKIIRRYSFDYVFIGGGDLLGFNYGFNSSLFLWSKYCSDYNIPIVLYGVSGTPCMNERRLKRYKVALSKCKYVFVRDKSTQNFFKNKYDIECECYPDCVFSYRLIFDRDYKQLLDKDYILFAPIMFYKDISSGLQLKSEIEYLNYLYNFLCDEISRTKLNKVILTCTEKDDQLLVEKFYSLLKSKNNKIIIEFYPFSTLDNYIKLVKKSKVVISCRMHAMILGKIYGAEIVPIKYKDKIIIFDKEYSKNMKIDEIEKEAYNSLKRIIAMM